jgi:hypothetical protein
MGGDKGVPRFKYQSETVVAVSLGECAVNSHGLAAFFERRLNFFDLHRHMTIHNHALGGIYSELCKNLIAEPCFMDQPKVRVVGLRISD